MMVLMEQIVLVVILAFLGLCMGSFAGATVWRLRARQLVQDKKAKEPYDKQEYKQLVPLTKVTLTSDRSRCLSCGHTLKWYDLLPLVSWLSTGGKCRYCQVRIGWFEPLIELGTAGLFAASLLLWPASLTSGIAITEFVIWLVAGVFLMILFAYDLKWFLLPNQIVFPLIGLGIIAAALHLVDASSLWVALASLGGAVVILSGLYLLLWALSKGQWIGFGDVKLGLALALLLGRWELAFIALFAANLVGCLLVLPGMLTGKLNRQTRVPFGPLLIVGFVIAGLLGAMILRGYNGLVL